MLYNLYQLWNVYKFILHLQGVYIVIFLNIDDLKCVLTIDELD